MRHLVIVRHGDYGPDRRISHSGRAQMLALAQHLKQLVNSGSVVILSSTAPRAADSAAILGEALRVEVELHDILWSDNSHPEDISGAFELVRSCSSRADVVVLVTHLEYTRDLSRHFAEKEWGVSLPLSEIKKGQARVLDCVERASRII